MRKSSDETSQNDRFGRILLVLVVVAVVGAIIYGLSMPY
jgi:uncharacterized membrane protein